MDMVYRRLGDSGLMVSALSFGSWVTFGNQVDTAKAKKLFTIAYDGGINFFDNAEVYAQGESERIMGKAIADLGWERDTYCVSSKVFWGGSKETQRGLSRKHIFDACHAALGRLQVDYLDLYFCHRPDIHTPVVEVVRAMDALVRQGKVMYWGTSEWPAAMIAEAYTFARENGMTPPSMEQPQYNMLHRYRFESEYAYLFRRFGMGSTIWSPLASGILTGKYADGIPKDSRMNLKGYEWLRKKVESEEGRKKIEVTRDLVKLADELGVPMVSMALAWCLKNENVSTVILGSSKPKQLKENLTCLDVLPKLTDEVMERIEAILENKPDGEEDFRA